MTISLFRKSNGELLCRAKATRKGQPNMLKTLLIGMEMIAKLHRVEPDQQYWDIPEELRGEVASAYGWGEPRDILMGSEIHWSKTNRA